MAAQTKTKCVKGHELTPENVRVTPSGRRMCMTCAAIKGGLTNGQIKERYGGLIAEALSAFKAEPGYLVAMAESGQRIEKARKLPAVLYSPEAKEVAAYALRLSGEGLSNSEIQQRFKDEGVPRPNSSRGWGTREIAALIRRFS